MALRLRRGTDAERQLPGFIPESGELIYITDTKLVYVGDGTTEGGLPISSGGGGTGGDLVTDLSPQLGGNLDLNSRDIIGTGSIDITGSISIDSSANIAGTITAASIVSSSANVGVELSTPTVNTNTLSAQTATSISLANDLNLNGNNIVGIGNVNIDGTITATGNINLGDENTDLITITGNISSNIVPSVADTFTLGSVTNTWQNGYFSQLSVASIADINSLTVSNAADINSLTVGNLYSQDSTIVYDSNQDSLRATSGTFDGIAVRDILNIEPFGQGVFIGSSSQPATLDVKFEGLGDILSLETTVTSDTFIKFRVSQGTLAAKQAVTPGDIIGGTLFNGWSGTASIRASGVVSQVDPDQLVTTTSVPGRILFLNRNSAGSDVIATFNSVGVLNAPILKTGEYATTTARDTDITAPEVGSIIFVSDTDELQVYNGTEWISVNSNSLDGDLIGSVFGDDSTVLVDSVNGLIVGDVVNSRVTTSLLRLTPYANGTARDTDVVTPAAGQIVYVADVNELQLYNGSSWSDVSKLPKDVEDIAGTAYTVSATDLGKLLTFRDAGAVTVTLPDAADVALPVGAYVEIANMDATNPISIAGTASQVVSKAAGAPSIPAFGSARAVKISSTEWLVTGDTA